MTRFDRTLLAAAACALWILALGELLPGPGAQAQGARPADRFMSEIIHDIVTRARAGEAVALEDGYDELEGRVQAIVTRVVQTIPQGQSGLSRQEIRAALTSCRLTGTVSARAGRLDARLTC